MQLDKSLFTFLTEEYPLHKEYFFQVNNSTVSRGILQTIDVQINKIGIHIQFILSLNGSTTKVEKIYKTAQEAFKITL